MKVASHILLFAEAGRVAPLRTLLEGAGHRVTVAPTVDEGIGVHAETGADVVVVNLPLAEATSAGALRQLRVQDDGLRAVVIGTDDHVTCAADSLSLGAAEYAADESALLTALVLAAGTATSHTQLRYLRSKEAAAANLDLLPARSPRMRAVLDMA